MSKKTISDLLPNDRHLTLTFELISVSSKTPNDIHCRIVDHTGIINAYFNQYVDLLVIGHVYTMNDLKVKVVDGHLQLQMSKTTNVERQPFKIGYKDKANDMSLPFYAKKSQLESLNNSCPSLSHNPPSTHHSSIKNPQIKSNNHTNTKNNIKVTNNKKHTQLDKQKQILNNTQQQQSPNQIKLINAYQLIDSYVSVCVWIQNTKNKQTINNKMWRIIIADDSGSMYAQFSDNTAIDGNQWYQLDNMLVVKNNNEVTLRESDVFEAQVLLKKHTRYNLRPIK